MNPKELQEKKTSEILHDARSSLSVIRLNCEMLLMDEKIGTEAAEVLKNNIQEVDRISEILGNFSEK